MRRFGPGRIVDSQTGHVTKVLEISGEKNQIVLERSRRYEEIEIANLSSDVARHPTANNCESPHDVDVWHDDFLPLEEIVQDPA
jgi:hypothetical protein